jgi:cation diffusion facilitator family transporter
MAVADPEKDSARTAYMRSVWAVTLAGLGINLLLAALKFAGGVFGGSQSLVADAVHSISDSITDMAVLIGSRYWTAPADEDHPHGHGRIEMLVSFFIGGALATVGIGLAWHAVSTLPDYEKVNPGWAAFAVALFSILTKEALYQWTARTGRRIRSSALIANAWHHRSDAFSSIPVAVAVIGTRLNPAWGFLDHIATIIVGILIVHAAWSIAWPALSRLLDAGADREDQQQLRKLALATPGVRSVHALRTRHIGPGLQADIHVMVDPEITVREGHNIAGAVKERFLEAGPDVVDVLIHIEPGEDNAGG